MNNKPQQVQNPALKKAMADMKAQDTPAVRNLVLNELMRATFLAPVTVSFVGPPPKADANGKIPLNPNTKISFSMVTAQDSKQYFMAFTDWDDLHKWRKDQNQQTVVLRFDDYAGLLQQNGNAAGFVINPYSENLRFDSAMVANLKKQKDSFAKAATLAKEQPKHQHRIDPGAKIVLLEPSDYPDAMVDAVCGMLADHKEVKAAYLQIMIVDEKDKSYLIVLDAPQDQALLQATAQAAQPFLKEKAMNLDITAAESPLGQKVLADAEPFYTLEQGRIRDEDPDEED